MRRSSVLQRTRCLIAFGVVVVSLMLESSLFGQTTDELTERATIAASFDVMPPTSAAITAPLGIDSALDVDPAIVTGVSTSGNAAQIGVFPSLGVITPQQGAEFLLLSTGAAGAGTGGLAPPEPGTNFGGGGALGFDTVTVTVDMTVPDGARRLLFDVRFLSSEFPDFVFAGFNDTFTAILTTSGGTSQVAVDENGQPISVDSAAFFPAFNSLAGGTGYDIFTDDPAGVDDEFGTGMPDAGLTNWITVITPVEPGDTISIQFGIADMGDGILDSSAIVDNLRFLSFEVLDANNPTFQSGDEVTTDTEQLATGGDPRCGAVADGESRLVLRLNLDSPAMVDFEVVGANSPESDGGVRALDSETLDTNLMAPSVMTSEGEQAFAVYVPPIDFVRAGTQADEGLAERTVTLRATITPNDGGPVTTQQIDLRILRPPVVLCHGLWSSRSSVGQFWASLRSTFSGHPRQLRTDQRRPVRSQRDSRSAIQSDGL